MSGGRPTIKYFAVTIGECCGCQITTRCASIAGWMLCAACLYGMSIELEELSMEIEFDAPQDTP